MSKKNTNTTADYIPLETVDTLINKLYDDGDYRMCLLVGCGCYLGIKISDLLSLKWKDIKGCDKILLVETISGKHRIICVPSNCKELIERCYSTIAVSMEDYCFLNRYGKQISIQMINRKLKTIKARYHLPINHFSTHSLRKTWGRMYYLQAETRGKEKEALTFLRKTFNHSNASITKKYLAIDQVSKVKPTGL